jgi:prolyl-tRNA synthetase
MKQSTLFTKTRKDAPKDEVAKNAQLLIRAGYIHKEMAGVYSFLPLGLRVLNNIMAIIREEMNAIGGQELSLTALQDKKVWETSGRWNDAVVDVWFKTALKNGSELGLAVTHEEPLTQIMTEYVSSYRDLPIYAYQFQTKFRNETRAKSGLVRGREFLMKDLYSFSRDEAEHKAFYEKARQAYIAIFKRLGIGDKTRITFASGGMFSKFSEEFQTESEAGEDTIFVDPKSGAAFNKEIIDDAKVAEGILAEMKIARADLVEKKAIEVGNIFNLGTKFSEPLELTYLNEKGEKMPVIMGSYGLGPSRVMGTIVEVLSDDNGIVWPASVAPFKVHLVALYDKEGKDGKDGKGGKVAAAADKLYGDLSKMNVDVLYDDRDLRPGEKFADSDLIGIPLRVVVSEKNLADGVVEAKERQTGKVSKISEDELLKMFANSQK